MVRRFKWFSIGHIWSEKEGCRFWNLSGIVVFSVFLEGSWPCVFDNEHEGSSDSSNVQYSRTESANVPHLFASWTLQGFHPAFVEG